MATHFVYMLFDNLKNCPLYVGVTKDLKTRYNGHKNSTLKGYVNINHVTIEVLEETDELLASKLEQYWYSQIKSWGFELLQKGCKNYKVPLPKQYSHLEIANLAEAFNKSTQTVIRWIKENSDFLTTDKAKQVLQSL